MADAETRERCIAAGADDLLLKPVETPALAALLRQWLGLAVGAADAGGVSEECALNMAVVETKPDRYRPTRSAGEHACANRSARLARRLAIGQTQLKAKPRSRTLLVVDDREANLVAMEALLGDGDWQVHTVNSGEAALKALLELDVELVLLDVQMPGMDGLRLRG